MSFRWIRLHISHAMVDFFCDDARCRSLSSPFSRNFSLHPPFFVFFVSILSVDPLSQHHFLLLAAYVPLLFLADSHWLDKFRVR